MSTAQDLYKKVLTYFTSSARMPGGCNQTGTTDYHGSVLHKNAIRKTFVSIKHNHFETKLISAWETYCLP